MIYLNNAATSWPKPPEVYKTADKVLRGLSGGAGRGEGALDVGRVVFEARERIASFFGIRESEKLIFTCNATVGINMVLYGLLAPGDHVVLSSMEHNAVARLLYALKHRKGIEYTVVPCAPDGTLDPLEVERALTPSTKLICLVHASNVSGTIMPIEAVGEIASKHGIEFLVDAAQTAGEIPIDVEACHLTLMAITGHKALMGPPGVGALYIKNPEKITPLICGGTGSRSEELAQPDFVPDKFESGTLNTPGIAALAAGVKFIQKFIQEKEIRNVRQRVQTLTQRLIQGLLKYPEVIVYGPLDPDKRTPAVSINIQGISPGEAAAWLAEKYGIATRPGLHCAPLAHATLGTLSTGTLRLSPGYFNTEEEIDTALYAIGEMIGVLRRGQRL
ncbi:MAG TPA: aminotransferase class V-fold PLP-dependent enzyme [Moorella mulderi]|nr:aminotransferase class V-fold PLP-dependent enzyme [Moorella mulderi]